MYGWMCTGACPAAPSTCVETNGSRNFGSQPQPRGAARSPAALPGRWRRVRDLAAPAPGCQDSAAGDSRRGWADPRGAHGTARGRLGVVDGMTAQTPRGGPGVPGSGGACRWHPSCEAARAASSRVALRAEEALRVAAVPLDVAVVAVAAAELLQELGTGHPPGDQFSAVTTATCDFVDEGCPWFSRGPEGRDDPRPNLLCPWQGAHQGSWQRRNSLDDFFGTIGSPSGSIPTAQSSISKRRSDVRVVRDYVLDLGNAAPILARLSVATRGTFGSRPVGDAVS